jgi:nucleotide-binding universal stress UspA family protein
MSEAESVPSRHILVGVDESDHARHALRWAVELAKPVSADIIAVNAWEKPPPYISPIADQNWDPDRGAQEMVRQVLTAEFGATVPDNIRVITREGNPAKVLVEASKAAYMLIVGRCGHSTFPWLRLGSVSGRCAEHGECAVLVVDRPPEQS